MHKRRVSLLGLLLAALVGCVSPTPGATGTPKPSGATTPVAVATATLPATAVTPTAGPAPSVSPTGHVTVEGPLVAGGYPIKALALAAGSPLRYATPADGLACSDDGGQTWRRVSDLALPLPLISPHEPRTLYAGAMASCYQGGPDPIFRRSTDGGETWQELAGGRGIGPVAEHPTNPGTLYGVSCTGLHLSSNGGETWQATGPTQGWVVTSILPLATDPLRFLAVLTSEGGTSHFAFFDAAGQLAQDLPQGFSFWGVGALAQAGGTLFLANATAVWRSEDGVQWQPFADGLADVTVATDPLTAGVSEQDMQRGFGLLALAVDPAWPERLALGAVRGLYTSEDRGEHWRPIGAEVLGQLKVSRVAWDPAAPGIVYATTTQGVYAVRVP